MSIAAYQNRKAVKLQPKELLDQTPPQDDESERGVLCCLMHDGKQFSDVAKIIGPNDFRLAEHQTIAKHLWILAERGIDVSDLTLLRASLEDAGDFNKVPEPGQVSSAMLWDIVNSTVVYSNAPFHAERVRDAATLRRVDRAGLKMVIAARTGQPVMKLLMDVQHFCEQALARITGNPVGKGAQQ